MISSSRELATPPADQADADAQVRDVASRRKKEAVATQSGRTRAAVVSATSGETRAADRRTREAKLDEAVGLAQAIDLDVVHSESVVVRRTSPGRFLGEGVIERLKGLVADANVAIVIVDARLSPVQQRNLERDLDCKVIDRTGLILEIFGARARTHEGRLQVELASLKYQRSRLVRSWTHLERQRGGFGFLGGPGESQLELDRRMIDDRIERIEKDLANVRRTRGLHREGRKRGALSTVALVGYTNAGKSTLFNRVAVADVFAKDLLFATLDPTMRSVTLPGGRKIVLSDTVGFVSDLPHDLVEAFRATLEEVEEADLIVHVRDISHPDSETQKGDVEEVLAGLGLGDRRSEGRLIEAWNKIDLLDPETRARIEASAAAGPDRRTAWAISAQGGEGVEALLRAVEAALGAGLEVVEVDVPSSDGATIAWLYRHGEVRARRDGRRHSSFTVALDEAAKMQLKRRLGARDAPPRRAR